MPSLNQTKLTIPDINNLIELLIGDDVPLCAVEHNSEVYLLNNGEGVDNGTKLEEDDLTRSGILQLLYAYAVHFGYTNEDFDEFVGG